MEEEHNRSTACLREGCQRNTAVSLCQVHKALSEIHGFDSCDMVWHTSAFLQPLTAGRPLQLYLDVTVNNSHSGEDMKQLKLVKAGHN